MIRIYTLAKELKIDSKELVEICQKVGLTSKSSALASLADEDVALVKNYIREESARSQKEADAAAEAASILRAVQI